MARQMYRLSATKHASGVHPRVLTCEHLARQSRTVPVLAARDITSVPCAPDTASAGDGTAAHLGGYRKPAILTNTKNQNHGNWPGMSYR